MEELRKDLIKIAFKSLLDNHLKTIVTSSSSHGIELEEELSLLTIACADAVIDKIK